MYVEVVGSHGARPCRVRVPLKVSGYFEVSVAFIATFKGISIYQNSNVNQIIYSYLLLDKHSLLSGGGNKTSTMCLTAQIASECFALVIAVHRYHHSKSFIISLQFLSNFSLQTSVTAENDSMDQHATLFVVHVSLAIASSKDHVPLE